MLTPEQQRGVLEALREEANSRQDVFERPRSYGELVPGVRARQVQYLVSKYPEYALGRRGSRLLSIEQEAGNLRERGMTYTQIACELGVTRMSAWRWAQKAPKRALRRGPAL